MTSGSVSESSDMKFDQIEDTFLPKPYSLPKIVRGLVRVVFFLGLGICPEELPKVPTGFDLIIDQLYSQTLLSLLFFRSFFESLSFRCSFGIEVAVVSLR